MERVNTVWHSLQYFTMQSFAKRVSMAVRMINRKEDSLRIFATFFHSAEGWYSEAVFQNKLHVKIAGRGFDDFSKDPVVISKGILIRCKKSDLLEKIDDIIRSNELFAVAGTAASPARVSVYYLPPLSVCIS